MAATARIADAAQINRTGDSSIVIFMTDTKGGSVAEWLACWTQAQKCLGSSRSRDAVG